VTDTLSPAMLRDKCTLGACSCVSACAGGTTDGMYAHQIDSLEAALRVEADVLQSSPALTPSVAILTEPHHVAAGVDGEKWRWDLLRACAVYADPPGSGKQSVVMRLALADLHAHLADGAHGGADDRADNRAHIRDVPTSVVVLPIWWDVRAWRLAMETEGGLLGVHTRDVQFREAFNARSMPALLRAPPKVLVIFSGAFRALMRQPEAQFCRFKRLIFHSAHNRIVHRMLAGSNHSTARRCARSRLEGDGVAAFGTGARFAWFVTGLPDGFFEQYDLFEAGGSVEASTVRHTRDEVDASLGLEPVTYVRRAASSVLPLRDYLDHVRRARSSSGAVLAAFVSQQALTVNVLRDAFARLTDAFRWNIEGFRRVPDRSPSRTHTGFALLAEKLRPVQGVQAVSEIVVLSTEGRETTPSERLLLIGRARRSPDRRTPSSSSSSSSSYSSPEQSLVFTEYVSQT